jgi:histone chaperone ASF1
MFSDIEWKVTYVGSAEDSSRDQVLEEVMVGPVPVGVNRFILQADAPDTSLIATSDLIGVTVVLITCSYIDQEFVKIGYYVNNEYNHPSFDPEGPLPTDVDTQYLFRNILADKPIVTRINIDWSGQQGGGEGGQMMMMPPPPTEIEAGMMDNQALFEVDDEGEVVLNEDSMDVEQVQVEARRVF